MATIALHGGVVNSVKETFEEVHAAILKANTDWIDLTDCFGIERPARYRISDIAYYS